MRAAIDETERKRREKQQAFNAANGIVPQGLRKKIVDVMQVAGAAPSDTQQRRKVAEQQAFYHPEEPNVGQAHSATRGADVRACARNLEFEQAAALRDRSSYCADADSRAWTVRNA